jgi:hypothetical protein
MYLERYFLITEPFQILRQGKALGFWLLTLVRYFSLSFYSFGLYLFLSAATREALPRGYFSSLGM